MFKNYLKIALRNIKRYKGYSFINITGLAFGIACCLLISRYVMFELSYDKYHIDKERIFRVHQEFRDPNGINPTSLSGAPLGPTLKENFPQVENYARMIEIARGLVKQGNISYYEDKRFYVDNDLFRILSIPFLQGDPKTALLRPGTIVITESLAKKYFGSENPYGQTITVGKKNYEITGITVDPPGNTHFHFNLLMSLKTLEVGSNYPFQYWFYTNFHTYIKLAPNTEATAFAEQIDPVLHEYYKNELGVGETVQFKLHPVPDIHLYSHLQDELEPAGNPTAIAIFALLSIFILLIACINFMNLATAKSAVRGKEVGIRKVAGAARRQLIIQFLSEAFMMSLLSIFVSLVIIMASLPLFNSIAGTGFTVNDFLNPIFAFALIAILVLVTFTAGGYPAFMLSSFQPITALKSKFRNAGEGSVMRKVLVVSQYTISILMIISTLIIYAQLNFMQNKNLGFDKEQKLILPVREKIADRYELIKNEFLRDPSFVSASFASTVPGRDITRVLTTSIADQPDKPGINMNYYFIDPDFLTQYGIQVVAGRAFQKELSSDQANSYLINETAAKALGWKSPEEAIGKKIVSIDSAETVIGVVKDFNYQGLQNAIQPMVLEWRPAYFRQLTLSLKTENIPRALVYVENKWKELFPGIPYEYFFLDEDFQRLYQAEENFGKLISTFTFLALMIASLGLFGLASFMTEQRTKEIGVRKVLGASITGIVVLLSREFIKWVFLANLIAWPLAYYFMNNWLQNFAYRITISWWMFFVAGILALVMALITVSYQSIKAAIANPVDSLRYE